MIRGYLTILGSARGKMYSYLAWAILDGIAQGVTMVMLVPIAKALFEGDFDAARRWLIALAVAATVCSLAHYMQSIKAFGMALTAMRSLHSRLGDHLVTLPLGWFTRDTVGKVSQVAVKGTMFVGSTGAHLITPVVLNATSATTVVIGLIFFDWRIGLVAVAGGVGLVFAALLASKVIATSEGRNHRTEVELNNRLIEFARCQPVLRAFGHTGDKYRPLGEALTEQHRVGRSALWGSVGGLLINGVAVQAVFSAIIATGAWLATSGDVDPISVIAIIGLAARFTSPLAELAAFGSAMRMATAEITRITDILEAESTPQPEQSGPITAPGQITFDAVDFSYADTPVLQNVSFAAAPGTMTALVGPSGSGKTTITRVIARFYDIDSGSVQVGGVDVRAQSTEQLMGQLALVFQDVYLFDDTLWENVKIGRPDATDDEIRAIAGTAGVQTIVDRLPLGWQTKVGEAGSALSGGERQRVSIARALLKAAPIVLFDEATSALDPENEHFVAESIKKLSERSTVLVIAHKLSTVVAADTIVVLTADGQIDDVGSHDELIVRGGQYAGFWNQRAQAAGWVMSGS